MNHMLYEIERSLEGCGTNGEYRYHTRGLKYLQDCFDEFHDKDYNELMPASAAKLIVNLKKYNLKYQGNKKKRSEKA